MLRIPLLAYGITHLTDARYFAAWLPDYLCFPLGEGGLTLDYFLAIREWVEGPVCVAQLGADAGAVFSPKDLQEQHVTHLLVDHGFDYPTDGFEVITRLPVAGYHSADDLTDLLSEIRGPIILDFTDGGITWDDIRSGHPFSLDELKNVLATRQELYFRIDLAPASAPKALPYLPGLAVRGSGEEKVGYKSFEELNDLFEELED
jgi:phosphoribosylanthranilate isomerase